MTALHDESEAQFDLQAPATGNKDGLLVQEELEVEKMIGDNYLNSIVKLWIIIESNRKFKIW